MTPGIYHLREDEAWWTLLVAPDGRAFLNSEAYAESPRNFSGDEETENEVLNLADETNYHQDVNLHELIRLIREAGIEVPEDLTQIQTEIVKAAEIAAGWDPNP